MIAGALQATAGRQAAGLSAQLASDLSIRQHNAIHIEAYRNATLTRRYAPLCVLPESDGEPSLRSCFATVL